MKTPWEIAKTSEYSNQVALFSWAAMAAYAGFKVADNPDEYRWDGARDLLEPVPALRWLHAVKNSGHGDAIRGSRARAEGVRSGVPDIFLPVLRYEFEETPDKFRARIEYSGLYIELKRPKQAGSPKGAVSKVQEVWHEGLRLNGYCVEVAYGWEEAAKIIKEYLKYSVSRT